MNKSIQTDVYKKLVSDITASYTYPARVESVIDGDTLWGVVDCGFETFIRGKLRFRGIDTPELGTPEEDKARRYVTRKLKACPVLSYRHTRSVNTPGIFQISFIYQGV